MADDSMRRRRELAARAFIRRRKDLDLTQEQVAQRAGVVVKTVSNLENGTWPTARSRALLEEAVNWEPGHLDGLVSPDGETLGMKLERLERELAEVREEYRRSQGRQNGHDGGGSSRASLPA